MKTIEEQAREYAKTDENGCTWAEGGCVRVDISEDVEYAFLAGAKAATRFISVKEATPEDGDFVRVIDIHGTLHLGIWHEDYVDSPTKVYYPITHWLPAK